MSQDSSECSLATDNARRGAEPLPGQENAPPLTVCRVCNNTAGNQSYRFREMMFGMGDPFTYFQCGACRCLQIEEKPSDLGRYYPQAYYSMNLDGRKPDGAVERFLKHQRARWGLYRRNLLGWALARIKGEWSYIQWLRAARMRFDSAILDVGSGSGYLLLQLADDGFTNVQGCDPYLKQDIVYPQGPRLYRRQLSEMPGPFDCLIFRHSFEHMERPREVLEQARAALRPGGFAIIATPVADCWAFREYKECWLQLDAPRHLMIHSRRSMEILAEQAGFELRKVLYDSAYHQFTGSELYRRGISLQQSDRTTLRNFSDYFTPRELAEFTRRSNELNARQEGDQAVFFLRRLP